jgi:hypothetical protein
MSSIVLEPALKEMLLEDCRDFLRSEDWYVHYLEFSVTRELMWSTGTLKGVRAFNTLLHAKMKVLMDLYPERNTLPTWVFAARCAGKVRPYPRMELSCG